MQRSLDFLPYPLRHQVADLALVHHLPHQRHGGFGNGESLGLQAGSKACGAQYAQRVLGEGLGNVA